MRASRFQLFQVLFVHLSLFFPLQSSVRADELPWENDPAFVGLGTELQEVAATQELCKSYLDLQDRNPEAKSTLSSLRSIIQNQISRGQNRFPIAFPGRRYKQEAPSFVPSILAPPEQLPKLPESLLAAFEARKTAYVNLIKATDPITELGLVSVCLLYQMNIIPPTEAFDRLRNHYTRAIAAEGTYPVTQITIDPQSATRLDTGVMLVQLARKLDRIDEISVITKDIPEGNHWAVGQVRRLTALIAVYSAEGADRFVEVCIESLGRGEISVEDIEEAVVFGEHPLSTISRIYLARLEAENPIPPSPGSVLSILQRSPPSDKPLLLRLVRSYLTSQATHAAQRNSLAAAIIQNEELAKRYEELVPELVDALLTPDPNIPAEALLQNLRHLANFLDLKLTGGTDIERWRELGRKFVSRYIETQGGSQIDEPFADQLLRIASLVADDELLDQVAKKTAKSFTWPFEKVYRFLKEGRVSTACVVIDHGNQDNLFPLYLKTEAAEELVALAEAALARDPDPRNTFIAMLLVNSIVQSKPDEGQRQRANELLQTVAERWGSIEHPSAGLLQQGNRVLWRNKQGMIDSALPALRIWVEQNPIRSFFPSDGPPKPMSDAQREIWKYSLNSGHFKKENAWLADLLTAAGIRGDAAGHRILADELFKTVSFGGFISGYPDPVSKYYVFVKTWMMIHADPSLQKQPPTWQGIHDELTGLGLAPERIAYLMMEVLAGLSDPNFSRGRTSIQSAALFANLAELKIPAIDTGHFARRWQLETWSPVDHGEPEAVFREVDAALGKTQNREVWASLLFSFATALPKSPKSPAPTYDEQLKIKATWAEGFRKAAAGSWLEHLADRYLERQADPSMLILDPLGEPETRWKFYKLPLSLRHMIATDDRLDRWLKAHPDALPTALPICADTICEAISTVHRDPQSYRLSNYCSVGRLGQIMLPEYQRNAAIFRPVYRALRTAADTATARVDPGDAQNLTKALKPLHSLLLTIESLDDKLADRTGDDVSPAVLLRNLIDSGETELALKLLTDPAKEFDFEYSPYTRTRPAPSDVSEKLASSIRDQTIAEVLEGIPAEMADRRMFFRLFTRPSYVSNLARQRGRKLDEELVSRNPEPLLADFDNHDFSDQKLEDACLMSVAPISRAGRFLPRKLRRWKQSIDDHLPAGNDGLTPRFHAWCDLVVYEGNHGEFDRILTRLVAQKPRDRHESIFRLPLDWPVIRWALEDGLLSGNQTREANCLVMSEHLLERTEEHPSPAVAMNRQLLTGILLAYHLSQSSDPATLLSIQNEIITGKPELGGDIGRGGAVDQAIVTAGQLAQTLSAETKAGIIDGLLAVHRKCPRESGSQTFFYSSFTACLIPLEAAVHQCQAELSENQGDLRNTLDLALLFIEAKEDEKARKLLDQLVKTPRTDLDDIDGLMLVRARQQLYSLDKRKVDPMAKER